MAPQDEKGQNAIADVDYVITYRFADTDRNKAVAQFQKLVETLASIGLMTEVRNGEKHSLLIFVKAASEQHLYGEVYRSRVKDWLHGIRTSAPDKEAEQTGAKQNLFPAERLRIVYQLINNPVDEGGAGITPKHGEWENVESIFALHDHEYNKAWLKKWSTSKMLKVEDLDDIRDRFGEKIAFYFAFTQAYFTALIGIAAVGTASWVFLGYFSSVYAVVNGLLCVSFVEYWKHQEVDLAIRWGVRGVSRIESKRKDFAAEKEHKDPVTGEIVEFFPAPKRFQRQLLLIPFGLAAMLALGTVIATCFGIEIFISEVYDGPGKSVLTFLPTGITTTVQPLILGLLTDLATRLTKYENYETDAAFDTALTQKIFVLNFVTSYMPILLTAFVYVPFASVLVPYLDVFSLTVKPVADNKQQLQTPKAGSFHINAARLRKQVIYFAVTAQIVNQALEILVPVLTRRGKSKYKEIQSKRAEKKGGSGMSVSETDPPEEAAFLQRVRNEAELTVYDVTNDFREMVIQYGYLSLFSVVWPLTSVSFLANNWLELRTDAAKICLQSQRPTPWRAEGIGSWLDSLGFLTWLGSITTAAIVYLFSNDGDGPSGSPSDIKLWGLLLSILASEHVYLLVQLGMQVFIKRLDSPGRQKERGERYMIRKRYMEENIGAQAAMVAPQLAQEKITRESLEEEARQGSIHGASTTQDRFWARQRGWQESAKVGVSLIEKAAPAESKKAQ
ncbi:MAG: hypothetical protein M1828_007236 [Chrysothrix sp. TS-e1954]|nr:MAG: hypothetical protein M1828_007236 [Chrysothrix sp. TS-e1954]